MVENPARRDAMRLAKLTMDATTTLANAVADINRLADQLQKASPVPLPEVPNLREAVIFLQRAETQVLERIGIPREALRG